MKFDASNCKNGAFSNDKHSSVYDVIAVLGWWH